MIIITIIMIMISIIMIMDHLMIITALSGWEGVALEGRKQRWHLVAPLPSAHSHQHSTISAQHIAQYLGW